MVMAPMRERVSAPRTEPGSSVPARAPAGHEPANLPPDLATVLLAPRAGLTQRQATALRLQSTAGNQVLGQLLAGGEMVTDSNSAAEREADRLGGTLLSGAGTHDTADVLLQAVGRQVSPGGPVRVHTGPVADEPAQALDARAFTLGRQVFFASGEYQPGTPHGQRLLAHELAHVLQNAQPDDGDVLIRRDERRGTTDVPASTSQVTPVDRCINPDAVSAAQLVAETDHVKHWLRATKPADAGYQSTLEYLQILESARVERVRSGEVWVADAGPLASPLASLTPGPDNVTMVTRATAGGAALASSPVTGTQDQLDDLLARKHIPRMDYADYAATAGPASQLHLPSFESRLSGTFSRSVSSQPALRGTWTGNLAELSARTGTLRGLLTGDLNQVPWGPRGQVGNFPIWDLQTSLLGDLAQVKSSAQTAQSGRFGVYDPGFLDIAGARRPWLFRQTAQTVFPNVSAGEARDLALGQGRVLVNLDDLPAFRQRVVGRTVNDPASIRPLIDNILREQTISSAAGRRYTSLDALLNDATLSAQERTQLLGQIARHTGERVGTHGLSTSEIVNLQSARQGFGLGRTATPSPAIQNAAWPEWLMAAREGQAATGELAWGTLGRTAARSGRTGGLIAVAFEGFLICIDPAEHPNWELELAEKGLLGFGSAGLGAAAQTSFLARLGAFGVGEGFGSRAWQIGGRSAGGGVGGGLAASAFELGSMLLDEREYTATDYTAKLGRAGSVGYLSGAERRRRRRHLGLRGAGDRQHRRLHRRRGRLRHHQLVHWRGDRKDDPRWRARAEGAVGGVYLRRREEPRLARSLGPRHAAGLPRRIRRTPAQSARRPA
jgi:hypothetical protein